MVWNWKSLGEAKCRWVPTQEADASHAGGTTSGLCPSGASHRHALPPSAASCPLSSGAASNSEQGPAKHEIRS